ncbi:hypothetical protein AB0E59_06205 [Lentzea sp. NPDC034063]|uniref:hypothetical protein n=1 Tax=unclassified Lentzea TaxID=2643253 RepID=UPI0033C74635
MPYAVWVEISDPDPGTSDEVTQAQRPELIMEIIEAGWEIPTDHADDEVRDILDVRVLTHPAGAFICLAVAVDRFEVATECGTSLAHHMASTPALFGWTLDSLRVEKLEAPQPSGSWLPELNDDTPRWPVATYLPREFQEMSAQYLIAAAVRHITDPTGKTERAADAADLISGAVREHPWDREIVGTLGALLVAACRREAATGTRHQLIARGEGDPELAEALLLTVRNDFDSPSTDYDDDRMRGHVLIEEFRSSHGLRDDESTDAEPSEERWRDQRRALLWAGFRVLATFGKDTLEHARSPWLWLSALDSDAVDPLVNELAERDSDNLEESDEETETELATAADALLLVRLALLHPELLEQQHPELHSTLGDTEMTTGPLHHVVFYAFMAFGAAPVQAVAASPNDEAAQLLLPVLQAIDAEEGDALDGLYGVVNELLPQPGAMPDECRRKTTATLRFLTAIAAEAGPTRTDEVARELFRHPVEMACAIVYSDDDDNVVRALQVRALAAAAAIDVTVVGRLAGELRALEGTDPRDEPALRAEALKWWGDTLKVVQRLQLDESLDMAALTCPDPGADLLKLVTEPENEAQSVLAGMSTRTAVVAIVQAVSALCSALESPELAYELLSTWD